MSDSPKVIDAMGADAPSGAEAESCDKRWRMGEVHRLAMTRSADIPTSWKIGAKASQS